MTSTRAVILDLDGTLVDSVYLHVVAWAFALERSEDLRPTPGEIEVVDDPRALVGRL